MNEFENTEQLLKPRCEFKASATLMQEVMKKAHEEAKPRRILSMWPWMTAACVAAAIMMFLFPSEKEKKGEALVAKIEKENGVANKTEPLEWRDNAQEKEQGPAAVQRTSVATETKRPLSDADMAQQQKAKETERIMELLDEADMLFSRATMQCTMDIEETSPQDEEPEETGCETNIVI